MKKFLHSLFYLFSPLIIGDIVALLIRNNIDYIILNKPIFAYLNIPYLIWILFATYLTIGIYFLN